MVKAVSKSVLRALVRDADRAGKAAATAVVPVPMTVVERADPFDDTSPVIRRCAPVEGGACGFASVIIRPAYSRLANVIKAVFADRRPHPHYYGGLALPVFDYGQSLTRKEAYARAFAKVLTDAGYDAYVDSRMD